MLITVATYRTVTGDNTTLAPAVSALIEEATELLEEALGRPLEQTQRTERMIPTRDGSLWPKATPILAAAGYTIDGERLISSTFPAAAWPSMLVGRSELGFDVQYTGGYVERSTADPDAPNRLPRHIARDIAWAAFELGQPAALSIVSGVPAGATSVSVGDVSVSFGANGAPARGGDRVTWSTRTLAYRYRVVRGA